MDGKSDTAFVKYPRLTKLMHNPIVWAVLAILSILGIVLTILTLFPPTKRQFTYTVESQSVISSEQSVLDDLEILYMGKKITSLQSTNIKIWNSGSEAIRNSDMASLRPLAISVTDIDDIYKASIIEVNNVFNQFSCVLEPEKSRVLINFEYVNPNDYVYVQVLHASSLTCTIDADIIGGAKKSVILYDAREESDRLRSILFFVTLSMCIIMIILALITIKYKAAKKVNILRTVIKAIFYLFIAILIIGLFVIRGY